MQNHRKALLHLKRDPVLSQLISKYGVIHYSKSRDYFKSLVYSIIEQQLSNKAAETIYKRFLKLFLHRKFTPELILATPQELLRGIGTSWAKARALHDLSQKVLDKSVQLENLESMTDEEIINHLTQVKGIGRWSAEMRLMFSLHRPDILPLDDVGIQNAFVKHYSLNRKRKNFSKKMQKIAQNWRPYRTLACWYLWKSLDNA
ncbi:hypothetical protein A3D85_00585 [Candidatus Amesbacteria bacterium RIFCSPHIGHO2_02_FULL_47_9]|uniref:DNA-3-methyladenine glycosylase II n=1 Tax=Candidatus Amesbacteria bacterium RIFCSPHIGHO2_01_FULL_48_32b TaxID=1797253 RepID=A0A1F4YHT8_9BACT|nr:MAG: hypothetical protein A2876_03830 [Candidatus Amesbacteria bacterium RIFCSPHIGHO2_01_FULL_48_32b]OGD03016.1 MAG: hypothetical protein A3D85_00585 [Candidatus Amesbacteria bacterium RIFCSPHIGHO2_02_FULL_47_9]OGD06836.1 MAG: hypothetical protein A2899_05055 [Candidatus Amesbacteria bacterium RIFCSPLOWO2_01_FULL_49_25]